PLKWKASKRIFVNSMSDLFQETVPDEYILQVADVMQSASQHIFQVLTKRASRMADLLNTKLSPFAKLKNIWWGVSVEDKRHGIPRIGELRRVPVATRFLSVEPLLEHLDLNLTGIHWVIVGGESGPNARKMERIWVESIRLQCSAAGVPFFFKQWGGVQKSRNGRMLNGRTYDEIPLIPVRTAKERMNISSR
ncbi:MAG: hypothetical protein DMG97_36260, partial [Acidobacteria bacterium]